jgi:hypothetical protein
MATLGIPTLRLAAALMVAGLAMLSAAPNAGATPLQAHDQLTITQTVTGIGLYSDLREWDRVLTMLAGQVTTDYVSVFGGDVETASRTDLVGQWRAILQGFDATQHLITNVAVDGSGDEATTRSHVRATHRIDDRFWTLGGVYTHRLVRTADGWRVVFMGIQRLYEEGDRALVQEASQRSAG